jgi:hypothetical protein
MVRVVMMTKRAVQFAAKDTGAIELMGGVSKTSRRDFILEPDINYYKF